MSNKKKRKVKKGILFGGVILVIVLIGVGGVFYFKGQETLKEEKIKAEKELVQKIKSKYSEYVSVSNCDLYQLKNKKYVKAGKVVGKREFSLEPVEVNKDTEYFHIKELDYYVKYSDVEKAEAISAKNMRYKNYIPFNENVVSKSKFSLYSQNEEIYQFNDKVIDSPIIEKDDNGYFIEFNGEELFIKKEDVEKTYEAANVTDDGATSIPVTVYHFIYKEGEACGESICHPTSQVREHFNYLKTNNFFTLNTTELRKFIEGKLRVPEKSLLITIDDGGFAWNVVPLLEEFQINATLFLITYRFTDLSRFASSYLELASHTHNLHDPYGGDIKPCASGSNRNALLTCTDNNFMLEDFKTSRSILNNTEAFCYPLYVYNDNIISVLKEAGFKMAFMGGGYNVERGIDLYKIPRRPLSGSTSMGEYMNIVNS